MAPVNSNGYMIFRHEKVGVLDILRLLFTKRRLTDYKFVDCSSKTALELGDVKGNWIVALAEFFQKTLAAISTPLWITGVIVEFLLNLLSLNGGFLGLLWHILTVSVVIPRREAANFRSIIGHIDGRIDLYKKASLLSGFPLMHMERDLADINIQDLTMMAAKIVYENEAYIKEVVNNHWQMYFVGFFDCWNKFLSKKATQAFVFCDKEKDANLICVAFRGTEPFNAHDWMTDFDFSSISMGITMGSVHLGFMKALGLQDEKNFAIGFPTEPAADIPDKPLAYYAIRRSLATLMAAHPNASIVVTGHSLGAALAALFPALLAFHGKKDMLARMRVITHAQPRVGNGIFAIFMNAVLKGTYLRTVYRYDIVPRVPPDAPLINLFTHFGPCVYYKNWYEYQEVTEVPNKNYFDPMYLISLYSQAWGDLIKGIFLGWTQGKDFAEGGVSLMYRFFVGILVPVVGPGIASHSPRDYVNSVRLANRVIKDMV